MSLVLVTGASGFVGRAVLSELEAHDKLVRAVVRKRRRDMPSAHDVKTLTIGPQTNWSEALENVSTVVHLADGARAHEGVRHIEPDDEKQLLTANLKLAQEAIRAGVKTFIYVSSIKAAAGEHSDLVLNEDSEPRPDSIYGDLKLKIEKGLQMLAADKPMRLVIIRNPIVYGPGARNNMARLMGLADSPWPLPLKGLYNDRSLISKTNLGNAIATVVSKEDAQGGIYFVHDGVPYSTSQIVEIFRGALKRPARLFGLPEFLWIFFEVLPGLSSIAQRLSGSLVVDDKSFRKNFDWTPPISTREGLIEMVRAYRLEHGQTRNGELGDASSEALRQPGE